MPLREFLRRVSSQRRQGEGDSDSRICADEIARSMVSVYSSQFSKALGRVSGVCPGGKQKLVPSHVLRNVSWMNGGGLGSRSWWGLGSGSWWGRSGTMHGGLARVREQPWSGEQRGVGIPGAGGRMRRKLDRRTSLLEEYDQRQAVAAEEREMELLERLQSSHGLHVQEELPSSDGPLGIVVTP